MSDCESISDAIPIRQGDVIKRIAVEGKQPLFIVITADCDIANVKFGDAGLACVELTPLYHYLLSDHGVAYAQRQIDRRFGKLAEWVNSRRREMDPDSTSIDVERIKCWVDEAPIEEVELALGVTSEGKASHVRREAEMLSLARAAMRVESRFRAIDAITALQTRTISRAEQARAIFALVEPSSLPLDVFFVSSVPGERGVGFLAKLRAISFVPFEKSFTSMAAAREHSPAYVRVGRLAPTFRHGLAQQFGMLFSRIGYPRSYENDRSTAFSIVAEEICNELESADAKSNSN